MKASTKALFVEAQRKLQCDGGWSLDDDELLLTMARAVLEGPREVGRASYQVQMTVCEGCGAGWQQAGGEPVVVEPAAVAAVMCDAQLVPSLERPPGPSGERSAGTSGERSAGPSGERPAGPPGERPAGPSGERPTGPSGTFQRRGRLYVDMGRAAARKRSGEPVERATQVVPKRVREAVVRRDGGRCSVPGCNNHAWLEVHHTEPVSDGGTNDPDLLCTLCGAHHRAAHEGRLVVRGWYSIGFCFTHPDGREYGSVSPQPLILDKLQTVTGLLRSSGFELREANGAVDRIRADVTADLRVEDVLRAALRQLV